MIPIETILAVAAILLVVGIVASKASGRFGIPSLLLFLFVGMLAGSEGLGGIRFDNPQIAQYTGVVALIFILFSGGLETEWKSVRPILREGIALSTAGVLVTAVLLGWFVHRLLGFSMVESLMLGAIVSSTDAAAVFAVLRSKKVSLAVPLRPLLELESGSNDPMSVFLTLGFVSLITGATTSMGHMIPEFFLQMGCGAALGYGLARAMVFFINRLKLEYDGLYPALMIGLVMLVYALTHYLHGNGFLAVYIAGVVLGNRNFAQKRNLIHFHSGLAWLMQIAMFVTLGLLVFPSRIVPVAGTGVLIALFLMLVARPAGVFLTLLPSRMNVRKKLFLSWVGLRGSVPIILATFPLIAGVPQADMIFNIVFFIVLSSALLQGTSLPLMARLLRVDVPYEARRKYPIELEQTDDLNTRLIDFPVPYDSRLVGLPLAAVGLPSDSLIALIARNEDFLVPGGRTVIESGDILLILVNNNNLIDVQDILRSFTGPAKP